MNVYWTEDELREIINLCSYALQTGLNTDVVWANEDLYQRHQQQVDRVKAIRQKAISLLFPREEHTS